MIRKTGLSNMASRFILKTNPSVTRLVGSREEIVLPQSAGSGGSIKIGNRYYYQV
jgi:hypothetical protein